MCWYSQSLSLSRHSPLAPLSQVDEWTAKPSRFSIQVVCRSFLELRRLGHQKSRISGRQWGSNFPRKGRKPIYSKKPESCAFSGFMVSISHVWEWKSTTGRFDTSRFWPFTWKTSSVGKDKVYKWKFCKLKITDYCCFCNHDSTHFSILRVSTNALYDCYSRIFDSFIVIH